MSVSPYFHKYAGQWRLMAAGVFSLLSIGCLWAGFDVHLSIKTASAEQYTYSTVQAAPYNEDFSLASTEALRSGVDSVALGVAGMFEALPSQDLRRPVLSKMLDKLTFDQKGQVYFTAWQGTRILHSPLTPDTDDMDFSFASDANGKPFVEQCRNTAERGGGFVRVNLARQEDGGIHSSREATEQIAYARLIPETDWYIVAFSPLSEMTQKNTPHKDEDLRAGLCVSGFSFVGLAGFMLVPPRRRKDAAALSFEIPRGRVR